MAITDLLSDQASRLKKLRLYLGLTRKDFEIKFGISRHTLRAWESGEKTFSDSAIMKVVDVLNDNGINCSYEWFVSGIGDSPILFKESSDFSSSVNFDPINEKTLNEVLFYKQNNPDIEVLVVSDDRFTPLAHFGDYIGLKSIDPENLSIYLGCIAYLNLPYSNKYLYVINKDKDGNYFFRLLESNIVIELTQIEFLKIKVIVWFKKLVHAEI